MDDTFTYMKFYHGAQNLVPCTFYRIRVNIIEKNAYKRDRLMARLYLNDVRALPVESILEVIVARKTNWIAYSTSSQVSDSSVFFVEKRYPESYRER